MDAKQVTKFVAQSSRKNADKDDKHQQGKHLQTCSKFKSL